MVRFLRVLVTMAKLQVKFYGLGFGQPFSSWTTASCQPSFLSPSSSAAESTSNSYHGYNRLEQNVFGTIKMHRFPSVMVRLIVVVLQRLIIPSAAPPASSTWWRIQGSGTALNVQHNLGVAPQLLIINKSRSADANSGWHLQMQNLLAIQVVRLNDSSSAGGSGGWDSTSPTATQFTLNGYFQ
jgi:hypothetical protein